MPRNNGVYTLPPVYFAENGEIIQPNQHNIPLQDVAQALTGSLPRDGTAAMTGDLPMGGRKVTGLGTGTAPGDAVRLDQLPATSGWLSSVAALTMAADRIPYATGAATAALAVFTAAGRAIVGAADAAAQRLALGLGALATKDKAAVTDIDATGTPGASTFLRGDGAWVGSIGWDQTWQDLTASRSANTVYQNTTGRPIMVSMVLESTSDSSPRPIEVSVDGTTWVKVSIAVEGVSDATPASIIVPNGHYYRVNGSVKSGHYSWAELR